MIAPPYFPLGSASSSTTSAPPPTRATRLPFYVYEFAGRSGYAIPVDVIEQLRRKQTNVVGLKVSDTPFDAIEPYLIDGMDVFIGSEPTRSRRHGAGAVGAVSGLASAWPEVVAALVHEHSPEAHLRVTELREGSRASRSRRR